MLRHLKNKKSDPAKRLAVSKYFIQSQTPDHLLCMAGRALSCGGDIGLGRAAAHSLQMECFHSATLREAKSISFGSIIHLSALSYA